jgi:uncharacterized membrane protein
VYAPADGFPLRGKVQEREIKKFSRSPSKALLRDAPKLILGLIVAVLGTIFFWSASLHDLLFGEPEKEEALMVYISAFLATMVVGWILLSMVLTLACALGTDRCASGAWYMFPGQQLLAFVFN